jgi:hypothetical protein
MGAGLATGTRLNPAPGAEKGKRRRSSCGLKAAKIECFFMNDSTRDKQRPLRIPGMIRGGVILSLVLSAATVVLYIAGSAPDPGFSDETQFLLLRILRYLSLVLIVFSLCAAGFSVRLMALRPRPRYLAGMALYLLTGILGAALVILNSVIVVAAGGNG